MRRPIRPQPRNQRFRLMAFSIGCLLFTMLIAIPVYLINYAAPVALLPLLEPEVVVQVATSTPTNSPPPTAQVAATASATQSSAPTASDTPTRAPTPSATLTVIVASPTLTASTTPTANMTLTPTVGVTDTATATITATKALSIDLILLPTPTPALTTALNIFTATVVEGQIVSPTLAAITTTIITPTRTMSATTVAATPTPVNTVTPTPSKTTAATPTPTASATVTPPPNEEVAAATVNPQISANAVSGTLHFQEKHYIPLMNIDSNRPLTIDMQVSPPNHPAAGQALTVYIVAADDWRQITADGVHPQQAHREVGRLEGVQGHIRANISQPSPPYYLVVVNDDQQPADYTLSTSNGAFAGQ